VADQLFFPLVAQPDEHVLAGTLQAFSVVLDKPDETFNVVIFFKVNGQYVTRSGLSSFTIRLAG